MDMVDFFIEKVKYSKYERDGKKKQIKKRVEIIKRKGQDDHIETVYETENGRILEINDDQYQSKQNKTNYYLSRQYSLYKNGGLSSYESIFSLNKAKTVKEAKTILQKGFDISCNMLLADNQGNIGI
jgi:acyl-homoserine lactone acylase PvdQ